MKSKHMMVYTDICSSSTAVAIAVVVLSIVYYFIKNRNFLPGPIGVPYFGIYPFLNHDTCYLQLEEYGKKYGDLFSFTSFGTLIINLGSAKAMKEAHISKSDCFEKRHETFSFLSHILKDGVTFCNGESWKVQRKFFLQTFKEYGLSSIRDNTAGPIYESIKATIQDMKSKRGTPFNVIELLTDKCSSTVRKVLFGDSISDEQIHEMLKEFIHTIDAVMGAKQLIMGPIGKLVFKTVPVHKNGIIHFNIMCDLLMEAVKKIEFDMNEDHPTCIVEEFYKEKSKRQQRNDATWKYFTDRALAESLFQIVGDGILTVSFFIGCFLYALVEHPEEQEKVYQELLEVVGPNRLPSAEDRGNLRYTNAFMNEVIRTANLFPLFVDMECTKETVLRGYRIPKGAVTLLNIWQAHHDPNTYDNPLKFDPSRFLFEEGKPKPESPVAFGLGKRACTGEAFVMLESFLYLTSIVMNFTISDPNPGQKSHLFLVTGEMVLSLQPRKE